MPRAPRGFLTNSLKDAWHIRGLILNLLETLGAEVHGLHSSEKGTKAHGVRCPARDHSATVLHRNGFHRLLRTPNVIGGGVVKKKIS